MTIKELKHAIETKPDDMVIWLQVDPEGNGYYEVRGVDPAIRYNDIIYHLNWSAKECDVDDDEYRKMISQPRILVVYP